jgi:2-polyprenyl-6-hydroxyphenyl methylase / 3-demethylubiquinone-9 3-methyltransferase
MSSRSYHEAIWEAVPPGLAPVDFERRRAFLLARVAAGERVLDVGCGEGAFAIELAREGIEVVAVDVAEEPLLRARARASDLDLRLLDAGGQWELEDSSFDVVWAGEVIEHVADTAAWLSEVRRVLRSGGRLLLTTPAVGRRALLRAALDRSSFAERFDPLSDHLRFYSRETLSALLGGFGFESIEVRSARGEGGRLLLAQARRARF